MNKAVDLIEPIMISATSLGLSKRGIDEIELNDGSYWLGTSLKLVISGNKGVGTARE